MVDCSCEHAKKDLQVRHGRCFSHNQEREEEKRDLMDGIDVLSQFFPRAASQGSTTGSLRSCGLRVA